MSWNLGRKLSASYIACYIRKKMEEKSFRQNMLLKTNYLYTKTK